MSQRTAVTDVCRQLRLDLGHPKKHILLTVEIPLHLPCLAFSGVDILKTLNPPYFHSALAAFI